MISIIVPIYNSGKYLCECIDALCNQTYVDIEIILVNDGSTDNSLSICNDFCKKDSRIKVVDKINGGVSTARNAGIEASVGEYIMFCDSDDVAKPEWCERLIVCAEKYPEYLPMCNFAAEYPDSKVLRELLINKGEIEESSGVVDSYFKYENESFLYLVRMGFFFSLFNKLYCADIIKNNGIIFNKNLSLAEDACFNLDYMSFFGSRVLFINEMLYVYKKQNPNSLSTTPGGLYGAIPNTNIIRAIEQMQDKLNMHFVREDALMYAVFFNRILSAAISCCGDKTKNKVFRIKTCNSIIWLPEFKRCIKNADPKKVGEKLLSASKNRVFLLIYLCRKYF